jgi:hypothetical protein
MNKESLKQFVEQNPNLVTMRESTTYPGLFVLKYKKQVFFRNLWNDFLENCRGTVVDKDFNVITRSPTKIYNFRIEDKAPALADEVEVTAYRKVNGFLACLTWHNKDVLISTTGSLDSDFIGYTKEMMLKHMCWADWQMAIKGAEGFTFFFEVVHPTDPHIVTEKPGMYLLGARENSWESKMLVHGKENAEWLRDYAISTLNCFYAEAEYMTVGELVKKSKSVQHEGYVAYTEDGQAFKIKSPYYLVQKALARKKDILMINKELVEEEYYPLIAHLNSIKDEFNLLEEQDRLNVIRKFLEAQ